MEIKPMHQRFSNLCALLLTLFSLCWLGTGYAATTSTTLHLPLFSSIDATGPVKIILTGQQPKQSIAIVAPPEVAQLVNTSVQNHTLIINAYSASGQSTPILIKISMSQPLNNLSLSGSAYVWGKHLSNPNMTITLRDTANIHLQGTDTMLHSIQNDGKGNVTVTNINSKILIVRGNSGRVTVSGETTELNVQIGGSLVLEAQGLHAEVGHIRTQNNATAYVCVLGPLHAFAYDDSNIYYYYNPSRLVRDTHASGNVLKITPDRRLVQEW